MATVIDSLLIELGLDASKFNEAQKKSVEELRKFGQENTKQNKEAQRQAKDLGEAYTKVRNSIIGIGVAIVGVNGFKDFVAQMVTGNAALGRTANLLNTTEKDLDAWHHAVEKFGGTSSGFDAAMQSIVGGLQKFKMGMGGEEVVTALARLGVQAKNGAVDLYELADAIKRVRDREGMQAAMALSQQLGLDQGTFQMLVQGSDAVRKLHDEMVRQSGASHQASDDAQRLQGKWALLKQEASGLGQALFGDLVPALDAVADALLKIFQITDRKKGVESIGKGDWWNASFQLSAADLTKALAMKSSGMSNAEIARVLNSETPATTAPPAGSGGTVGGNLPRNMRNHNPGNIEYGAFARAHGATGSDGRFAIFPDDATGNAAMQALLESKRAGGLDTISKLIGGSGNTKGWLGSGADAKAAPSYIADVSRRTGLGADQHLSASQMASVQSAMAAHEGWVGARATAPQMAAGGGSKVETNIGTINVSSQATDANGVARDMHTALANNALITAGMVGAN